MDIGIGPTPRQLFSTPRHLLITWEMSEKRPLLKHRRLRTLFLMRSSLHSALETARLLMVSLSAQSMGGICLGGLVGIISKRIYLIADKPNGFNVCPRALRRSSIPTLSTTMYSPKDLVKPVRQNMI